MKYGMNLLLWSGEVTDAMLPTLEKLKAMGYDGVELPIFNLDLDYAKLGKQLDSLGLARTAVTVRNVADNPISPDANARKAGVELNKKTLDCCAAAGVETLVGPFHSALGHFPGHSRTPDEWKWGVESMRATAEHAGKVGVMLGLEPLNRFEVYFLNAHVDAAKLCREVNHPHCRMMYDTFHANIEEKSIPAAMHAIRDMLVHIHISENDRSTPGHGNVRWKENFDAIRDTGYDGWLVIEAFGLALPELAAATRIWRKMFDSELKLAEDGLRFMKQQVEMRRALS
jgi:D-psicose/D-tagatose/L-ribulose 3-epimerase